tara:strand:+ start:3450 stop:3824 length:375 start_codon:yes stop_codon:yes gene_type:complete
MSLRTKKIEKQLQDIISMYMLSHFPYKNDLILSITNVVVSPDLRSAKVYFSVFSPLASEIEPESVLEILEEERPNIQEQIHTKLKMKFTPRLTFYFDETIAENFRLIEKLKALGYAQDLQSNGL